MPDLPTLSIVVEWDNAGRIGFERGLTMLARLRDQLLSLPRGLIGGAEILMVFEAGAVDEAALHAAIDSHGSWPAPVRYVGCETGRYYELKNLGVDLARGDIIAFIDSDVIPEAGWLKELLAPFGSHGAEIVAGATSVERSGLYSTAMALGWIFPLPPEDRKVSQGRIFYANNVAFRREMAAVMRFPEARQYRVQVGVVQGRLASGAYRFLSSPGAAVLHPPPQGLAGFVTRALWCGYDSATAIARDGPSLIRRAIRSFGGEARGALAQVRRDRRRAGLGLAAGAAASGFVAAYHGIRLVGFVSGLLAQRATWKLLNRIAP